MVECADGTLYTGSTNDVEKRVATHNAGKGAKYTRSRLPVTIRYWEECSDRSSAATREAALKKIPRSEKEALVAGFSSTQM